MPAKALLLRIHRWTGLIAGLLIILQGLTGSLVAFRHDLNRLVHPHALVVAPPTKVAPLAAIAAAAKAAYPDRALKRIDLPVTPDEAYLARMETPQGGIAYVAVDPSTAKVLRAAPLAGWPVEFAYQIHMALLSGETGERIVGFTGFFLLLMAITGPWVWWPGVGRMRQQLAVNLSTDLHRFAGLFAAPVILLTAGTGVLMAWQPWLEPAVRLVAPLEPAGAPKAPPRPCAQPATLDQSVEAAASRRPGQVIKSVRFPGKAGKVVAVYFRALNTGNGRATDHVWVDACSARVLKEKGARTEAAGSQFFSSLLWIHTGQWLGIVGRVLALLVALTIAGLGITGLIQWLVREARTRRNRAARKAKAQGVLASEPQGPASAG
jgi:uncharacterized iron-regulated membrane protein